MNPLLRHGDIITTEPIGPISKLIQLRTGKQYTHNALYLGHYKGITDAVLDAEKSTKKFEPIPLKAYSNDNYRVYRVDAHMGVEAAKNAIEKFEGEQYDLIGLIKAGLRYEFNKQITNDLLTCSGMVDQSYLGLFSRNHRDIVPWTFKDSWLTGKVYENV